MKCRLYLFPAAFVVGYAVGAVATMAIAMYGMYRDNHP